jgi:hypothetical protein
LMTAPSISLPGLSSLSLGAMLAIVKVLKTTRCARARTSDGQVAQARPSGDVRHLVIPPKIPNRMRSSQADPKISYARQTRVCRNPTRPDLCRVGFRRSAKTRGRENPSFSFFRATYGNRS